MLAYISEEYEKFIFLWFSSSEISILICIWSSLNKWDAFSAHSITVIPFPYKYSSIPNSSVEKGGSIRYRSIWNKGILPVYSVAIMNVGLLT